LHHWKVGTWKPGPKFTKELVDVCLNERAESPVGLRREELPVIVSRALGFKSISPKVKELVDTTLTSMHEAGDVVSRSERNDAAGSPEGTERLASLGAHGRRIGAVPACPIAYRINGSFQHASLICQAAKYPVLDGRRLT
jgi:hypothetical protein